MMQELLFVLRTRILNWAPFNPGSGSVGFEPAFGIGHEHLPTRSGMRRRPPKKQHTGCQRSSKLSWCLQAYIPGSHGHGACRHEAGRFRCRVCAWRPRVKCASVTAFVLIRISLGFALVLLLELKVAGCQPSRRFS